MKQYKKIVLNIPHSSTFIPVNTWEGDIEKEVQKWTDHKTDVIFSPKNDLKSQVIPVIFPYSRFFCDAERLEHDPLEMEGQGIFYTDFNGCHRPHRLLLEESAKLLWKSHQEILSSQIGNDDTLLIDCHSFPSELASDVDICLGWNNDTSKPSDALIEQIKGYFEGLGYRVGLNNPYSNSMTPNSPYYYQSVMIELNKRIYLNEKTGELLGSAYKLNHDINYLYENILSKWEY